MNADKGELTLLIRSVRLVLNLIWQSQLALAPGRDLATCIGHTILIVCHTYHIKQFIKLDISWFH